MSCVLTTGRKEPCKDNAGGIKTIYLAKFVLYDYTQITGIRGVEILTFPATSFYQWKPNRATFDEQLVNDENGIYYDQVLTVDFAKRTAKMDIEYSEQLRKSEIRFIVVYNNGKIRMGGVWNGANVESYKRISGGSKSDFSGYRYTIRAKEEFQAAFMASVEIPDIGIAEILLLEDLTAILLEDGQEILLE